MTTVGEHLVPATTLTAPDQPHGDFGVVVDDTGPVALVTAGTSRLAELPPAVLVTPELTLAELADSPVLTVLDAYPELAGFVVVDEVGAVVGVLPVEVLDAYLASGRYVPPPSVMGPGGHAGDVDVPGDPRLPRARIRCRASRCGYVNTVIFLDPANLPDCENPELAAHPLAIGGP